MNAITRAATKVPRSLRHPQHIHYPLLVFYCPTKARRYSRLVDLIIQIIHKISVRAERKVIKELATDLVKVHGKTNLLFRIAEALLEDPEGRLCDVISLGEPKDDRTSCQRAVRGPSYTRIIYTKIRTSYAKHYQRMVPRILVFSNFAQQPRMACHLRGYCNHPSQL